MDIREELKSAGVYPTGPCSAWPEERNKALMAKVEAQAAVDSKEAVAKYKARHGNKMPSMGKMARGLMKTAGQAIRHGKVSEAIRNERYGTCKTCPAFDPKSKRCSDCGCFMEAKTWVGGDPKMLCPQKKWER